jgi:hypothetical protein
MANNLSRLEELAREGFSSPAAMQSLIEEVRRYREQDERDDIGTGIGEPRRDAYLARLDARIRELYGQTWNDEASRNAQLGGLVQARNAYVHPDDPLYSHRDGLWEALSGTLPGGADDTGRGAICGRKDPHGWHKYYPMDPIYCDGSGEAKGT